MGEIKVLRTYYIVEDFNGVKQRINYYSNLFKLNRLVIKNIYQVNETTHGDEMFKIEI